MQTTCSEFIFTTWMAVKIHLAPRKGEIYFSAVKAQLKENVSGIMELKPGTADEDVKAGIGFLREMGLG